MVQRFYFHVKELTFRNTDGETRKPIETEETCERSDDSENCFPALPHGIVKSSCRILKKQNKKIENGCIKKEPSPKISNCLV